MISVCVKADLQWKSEPNISRRQHVADTAGTPNVWMAHVFGWHTFGEGRAWDGLFLIARSLLREVWLENAQLGPKLCTGLRSV